jgi:hypothetical protein
MIPVASTGNRVRDLTGGFAQSERTEPGFQVNLRRYSQRSDTIDVNGSEIE